MSDKGATSTSKKTILTAEQEAICLQIAGLDDELSSQRAKALLSINDGLTQAAAAEASGLTVGQVRYLMTLFRKDALGLFPEEIMSVAKNSDTEAAEPAVQAAVEKEEKKEKKAEKPKRKDESDKKAKKDKKEPKKEKKKRTKLAKKNKTLKAIRKQSKKKKNKKGRKKKK